jgi:UPF0755 protein
MLTRLLLSLVLLALAGAGAAFGAWTWAKQSFDAPGPQAKDGATETRFEIARGDGLVRIADNLKAAGLFACPDLFRDTIGCDRIFKVFVAQEGKSGDLKAGEYAIPSGASMRAIMDLLVEGKVITYSVTAPEGRTSAMIVRILNAEPDLTGPPLPEDVAEGALLPETYVFERNTSRQQILERMKRDHDKLLAELWEKRDPTIPVKTPYEAVILASIVEKETGVAEERPRVAAVFVNRLRKGMKLQSDPTIIYGITKGEPLGRGIRKSELEAATPYNTYVIDGLPPTPIACPGRASLEAVMNPPKSEELFFVADGTGGHAFAETYEEHQKNVAKWREIERQRAEEERKTQQGTGQ